MRIAILIPISWRTPPRHYGPWELVAGLLADGLLRKGVDVTLYATGDSITSADCGGWRHVLIPKMPPKMLPAAGR